MLMAKVVPQSSPAHFVWYAMQENADEQLKWLEKLLQCPAKDSDKKPVHTIAFQHIPPFVRQVDESEQWCNLPVDGRMKLLELLDANGVKWLFCGHFHNNAYGSYKNVNVVITSSTASTIVAPKEWDYAKVQLCGLAVSACQHNFV